MTITHAIKLVPYPSRPGGTMTAAVPTKKTASSWSNTTSLSRKSTSSLPSTFFSSTYLYQTLTILQVQIHHHPEVGQFPSCFCTFNRDSGGPQYRYRLRQPDGLHLRSLPSNRCLDFTPSIVLSPAGPIFLRLNRQRT